MASHAIFSVLLYRTPAISVRKSDAVGENNNVSMCRVHTRDAPGHVYARKSTVVLLMRSRSCARIFNGGSGRTPCQPVRFWARHKYYNIVMSSKTTCRLQQLTTTKLSYYCYYIAPYAHDNIRYIIIRE